MRKLHMVNVSRQDLKQLHYTGKPLIRKAVKVDAQFQCPKHFQMIMSPKNVPQTSSAAYPLLSIQTLMYKFITFPSAAYISFISQPHCHTSSCIMFHLEFHSQTSVYGAEPAFTVRHAVYYRL
ncbi:hypothetical protein HKD37_18G052187 [Glycine soja]